MHVSKMRSVRCSGRLGGEGGVYPGRCTPPPCGQTDACENITFPQLLLRMVKSTEGSSGFLSPVLHLTEKGRERWGPLGPGKRFDVTRKKSPP